MLSVRRLSIMVSVAALALALAASAQATHRPTAAQARGLSSALLGHGSGGQIGWATVSSAGPFAVAWLTARPHHSFQSALVLAHRSGGRWHRVADIYHGSCPGLPRAVALDLRHFFHAREPKFLAPGLPGYHGCAARIAYAK